MVKNEQHKILGSLEMQRELSSDVYKIFERLKLGWQEKSEVEAAMRAEGFCILDQPPLLPKRLIQVLAEETGGITPPLPLSEFKRRLEVAREVNQEREDLENADPENLAAWARVIITLLYSGLLIQEREMIYEALALLVDLELVLHTPPKTTCRNSETRLFEPWNL